MPSSTRLGEDSGVVQSPNAARVSASSPVPTNAIGWPSKAVPSKNPLNRSRTNSSSARRPPTWSKEWRWLTRPRRLADVRCQLPMALCDRPQSGAGTKRCNQPTRSEPYHSLGCFGLNVAKMPSDYVLTGIHRPALLSRSRAAPCAGRWRVMRSRTGSSERWVQRSWTLNDPERSRCFRSTPTARGPSPVLNNAM